jgi:hypothetical protein
VHNNTQFQISNSQIARGGVAIVTIPSVVISGSIKPSCAASETILS